MSNFLHAIKALALLSIISILTSCGNNSVSSGNTIKVAKTSGFNANHGPFDSRGNYREDWADNPPRRVFVNPNDEDLITQPPVVATEEPTIVQPTTKPVYKPTYKPTVSKPYVKPAVKKPIVTKPTYVKPPKAKPPILHIVRKGDTLYGLSQKYKSGVKTIQIANGLKGTTIRIGQTLKIPRF